MRSIGCTRVGLAAPAALAALVLAGCGGATRITTSSSKMLAPSTPRVAVNETLTRRGAERDFTTSETFGAPRGRKFEDLIPIDARIAKVNVHRGDMVNGIWLTVERNGNEHQTPLRGGRTGRVETFELGPKEKIVGIHGYGHGGIEELVVATNHRIVSFGSSPLRADDDPPACAQLTEEQKRQFVGIGITGRADSVLRQLSLRIQIRQAR